MFFLHVSIIILKFDLIDHILSFFLEIFHKLIVLLFTRFGLIYYSIGGRCTLN